MRKITTIILASCAHAQLRLRQIIPSSFEEIVDEITDPISPGIEGGGIPFLGLWSLWKDSYNALTENLRVARVNFLEDVDDALTAHTNDIENLGLPSPLIQGVAEWNSYWPFPVLLPDMPILGPLNPFLWATGARR